MDEVREQGIPGTPVCVTWDDGDAVITRLGWLQDESDEENDEILLMTQYSEPDYHNVIIGIPAAEVVNVKVL